MNWKNSFYLECIDRVAAEDWLWWENICKLFFPEKDPEDILLRDIISYLEKL